MTYMTLEHLATPKCHKLQFFERPLEAGTRSESILIKMSNFTAETNMFSGLGL